MIITFILTLIGIFGTLTIIACLRQVEDEMPALLEKMDIPDCPVCHIPHQDSSVNKMQRGFRTIKSSYQRKRKAAFGYCNRKKSTNEI